ncbi:MAG: pseudouridine synthase [Actinomycetota bacterium]|nr:pseudouridine synthase [Actinomycetota bacterium]
MSKIRISRFLAECGINSRRKCELLVLKGHVKVNGTTVSELYLKVDPDKDVIEYNGKLINIEKKVIIALNKPKGYLCTLKDTFNRHTILELLKNFKDSSRIYPVGRLDYNSRGLIIMTNDGNLAYKVLHPKFNILKTYEIILNSELKEDDIKKIKKGVIIDGTMFEVQDMQLFFENDKKVKITIHEGRKRIIRRVFKSLGYEVADLKRIRIGNYEIKDMQEGTYKELRQSDVRKILMIDD